MNTVTIETFIKECTNLLRSVDILNCINRWAQNGVYIQPTTPDHRFSKYYICKYVRYLSENSDIAYWHLHENGWQPSSGSPFHITAGLLVNCPKFNSMLDAANFAYRLEQKFGRLETLPIEFNETK